MKSDYSFTPRRAHPWLKSCSVEDVLVGREVTDGMKGRDGRRVGGASWSPDAQRAGLGVSTVHGLGRVRFWSLRCGEGRVRPELLHGSVSLVSYH